MDSYLVVIGEAAGRRTVARHAVPHTELATAFIRQNYEALSDRALNDAIKDMKHEQHRRAGTLAVLGVWDPEKTQRRS